MASGATLLYWTALDGEPPATNYATGSLRNQHPVLQFDTTTQETTYFSGVMPRNYAGGGVTVYLVSTMASATSGTIGWDVSFERISDATTDTDADSFATAQTVTAATVSGTSGVTLTQNVAITNGANMDSVAVGELFRIRIRRDVANDSGAGDGELWSVEIKET